MKSILLKDKKLFIRLLSTRKVTLRYFLQEYNKLHLNEIPETDFILYVCNNDGVSFYIIWKDGEQRSNAVRYDPFFNC